MNEELKPCPFCGGPVELERAHVRRDRFEGDRQFWGIVCRNTFNHGGSCCMEQVPSASPEAAIKRWNSRPDIDRIADLERQLAEALAAVKQVKSLVCGDKHPNWSDDDATYRTRGKIADVCDIATGDAPACFSVDQPTAQQVEDARDAARWRHVTEIMGLRFKPSNERAKQSLEETNATVDAEIAALQAGKEKEHGN